MNYTATIDGNSIVGKLVSKDQKAKFTMQFAGVRSPKEGTSENTPTCLIKFRIYRNLSPNET